jgi:hypothetical protein
VNPLPRRQLCRKLARLSVLFARTRLRHLNSDNFAEMLGVCATVTVSSPSNTHLSAQVSDGPLSGLRGSVVATTPQGKTYLRLNDLPGVTVLLPSHLLQLPAAAPKSAT